MKKAPDNPWGALTLEWTLPSPPAYHAFNESPIVTAGPYDYDSEGRSMSDIVKENYHITLKTRIKNLKHASLACGHLWHKKFSFLVVYLLHMAFLDIFIQICSFMQVHHLIGKWVY